MRQINVLLVEDNPGDAELTRQSLEASKLSVHLTVVDDGEKALKYLRRAAPYQKADKPDLVLLDLNLPKLPGGEVLKAMKGDKALRGIPVVVLTTSEEESEISRCYAEGANCYVVKPVDFKSFMGIVSAIEEFWFSVVKLNEAGKTSRSAKPGGGVR